MTTLRVRCNCGHLIAANVQWKTRGGRAVLHCPVCGATNTANVKTAEFWERYEARRAGNGSSE